MLLLPAYCSCGHLTACRQFREWREDVDSGRADWSQIFRQHPELPLCCRAVLMTVTCPDRRLQDRYALRQHVRRSGCSHKGWQGLFCEAFSGRLICPSTLDQACVVPDQSEPQVEESKQEPQEENVLRLAEASKSRKPSSQQPPKRKRRVKIHLPEENDKPFVAGDADDADGKNCVASNPDASVAVATMEAQAMKSDTPSSSKAVHVGLIKRGPGRPRKYPIHQQPPRRRLSSSSSSSSSSFSSRVGGNALVYQERGEKSAPKKDEDFFRLLYFVDSLGFPVSIVEPEKKPCSVWTCGVIQIALVFADEEEKMWWFSGNNELDENLSALIHTKDFREPHTCAIVMPSNHIPFSEKIYLSPVQTMICLASRDLQLTYSSSPTSLSKEMQEFETQEPFFAMTSIDTVLDKYQLVAQFTNSPLLLQLWEDEFDTMSGQTNWIWKRMASASTSAPWTMPLSKALVMAKTCRRR